jgi:TfoX/Sxy family transcriptional regulator of competence genes
MKGYHIYSQFKEDTPYDVINHLGLLASILTWKKHFGSIHLYTNKKFLETISKWDLHLEYDSINTYELDNAPHQQYLEMINYKKQNLQLRLQQSKLMVLQI